MIKLSSLSWVQNTYYLPSDKAIPQSEEEREDHEIKYYQWVTFVLLFQAFMFYLPRIFWTTFSLRSGLNIGDLVSPLIKRIFINFFNGILFGTLFRHKPPISIEHQKILRKEGPI